MNKAVYLKFFLKFLPPLQRKKAIPDKCLSFERDWNQ